MCLTHTELTIFERLLDWSKCYAVVYGTVAAVQQMLRACTAFWPSQRTYLHTFSRQLRDDILAKDVRFTSMVSMFGDVLHWTHA